MKKLLLRKAMVKASVEDLRDALFGYWTALEHATLREDPDPWAALGSGQEATKRAITVAAVQGHPTLLYGSPDSGKAALAAGAEILHVPVFITWPCPCGWFTHPHMTCRCSPGKIEKWWLSKVVPLQNQAVVHVRCSPIPVRLLLSKGAGTNVGMAKEQLKRVGLLPSEMYSESKSEDCRKVLEAVVTELKLGPSELARRWDVARSVAALAGHDTVRVEDLLEAVQYRAPEVGGL